MIGRNTSGVYSGNAGFEMVGSHAYSISRCEKAPFEHLHAQKSLEQDRVRPNTNTLSYLFEMLKSKGAETTLASLRLKPRSTPILPQPYCCSPRASCNQPQPHPLKRQIQKLYPPSAGLPAWRVYPPQPD